MTLADHLAEAHRHSVHGGVDPAASCSREIDHSELAAKRAQLQQVAARSHVARVQIAFIERVLRLKDA